jgi:hypothetical protein
LKAISPETVSKRAREILPSMPMNRGPLTLDALASLMTPRKTITPLPVRALALGDSTASSIFPSSDSAVTTEGDPATRV